VRTENLQTVIKAVPFRPFTLVTADGTRVHVSHPEWIAFAGGRTALVTDPDDRVQFVDVALVTLVDLAPPIPAGSPAPEPDGGG
jgi:hypothetical protein